MRHLVWLVRVRSKFDESRVTIQSFSQLQPVLFGGNIINFFYIIYIKHIYIYYTKYNFSSFIHIYTHVPLLVKLHKIVFFFSTFPCPQVWSTHTIPHTIPHTTSWCMICIHNAWWYLCWPNKQRHHHQALPHPPLVTYTLLLVPYIYNPFPCLPFHPSNKPPKSYLCYIITTL